MYYKLGIEVFILIVPVIVFIFKRNQIQYVLLLVVSLLIYFVLISYTQKSIFQEKLLEIERNNVSTLEKQVEERTDEIIRILNTEYVTGLYSRRYFESRLSELIKVISGEEKLALLYIDQNKSKAIKYLYGKETAENLLKLISETLQEIVFENYGMIAAYGDDIFVIMIRGKNADVEASNIAEQIIERFKELFYVDNHAIRVTLNIGISCYPLDTSNVNDLVKNADIAMMQARTKGFNKIQMYNGKLGDISNSRHRIELKLKKVDFDKEFQLYYQPQVNCCDGTLSGFEALLRWFEGGKNYIAPLDFIPVAEETGIIVPLGYWIIESAAKQGSEWNKKTGKKQRIAVNVSSKQLVEVDFVSRLKEIVERYEIQSEYFEIEITESQEIENSISIRETLDEIHKLGFSIAIDDFGTGYSSLYYIKNIPVERIKIAKELIDKIEEDVYSRSIVQMAISIAKVKDIKVIAEGVETLGQWQCLKEIGCDEIQGYYFSKPYNAEEIEGKWLI